MYITPQSGNRQSGNEHVLGFLGHRVSSYLPHGSVHKALSSEEGFISVGRLRRKAEEKIHVNHCFTFFRKLSPAITIGPFQFAPNQWPLAISFCTVFNIWSHLLAWRWHRRPFKSVRFTGRTLTLFQLQQHQPARQNQRYQFTEALIAGSGSALP